MYMETHVDYTEPLIRNRGKTALVYNDAGVSYEEVLRNIDGFSRQFDLEEGERSCLFAENRPEWIYAFYAVWKQGGINSAVDSGAGREELLAVLEDCRPKIVFVSRKSSEIIDTVRDTLSWDPRILVLEEMGERLESERPDSAAE